MVRTQWQIRAIILLMALLFCATAHAGGWELKDQQGVIYQQGDAHSKADGKWVLVNFWAPWCPACLAEMPDLVKLQQRQQRLQIIGVAVMYRSQQAVTKAAQQAHLNYPIVMGNEDIASNFGSIRGLPSSFLYAPNGKLVAKYAGPLPIAAVEQLVVSDHR
ncbi:MAG: TlpA disulfide reductase family protein [Mariprofundales bacterium]|nr:TlpA disulfide reductase family protein [Mariprofundales bacterium]